MLTEEEKAICKSIIYGMDNENVYSLAQTVTMRNVNVITFEEAVDAIAMYSKSLEEFLRRRKVKREHLFQYLIRKEPSLPSTMEKEQLIKKILSTLDRRLQGAIQQGNHQTEDLSSVKEGKSSEPVKNFQNGDGQLLAEHFVPWFFELLNSLHVSLSKAKGANDSFGCHHFWKDSSFSLEYISEQGTEEQTVCGASLVCESYTKLICMDRLLFNPNLSSTQGKMDPHGLVSVFVSGTVHRDADPCGVFEKIIGLIRDPLMQNNWKVKYVRLRLKGKVLGSTLPIESGN